MFLLCLFVFLSFYLLSLLSFYFTETSLTSAPAAAPGSMGAALQLRRSRRSVGRLTLPSLYTAPPCSSYFSNTLPLLLHSYPCLFSHPLPFATFPSPSLLLLLFPYTTLDSLCYLYFLNSSSPLLAAFPIQSPLLLVPFTTIFTIHSLPHTLFGPILLFPYSHFPLYHTCIPFAPTQPRCCYFCFHSPQVSTHFSLFSFSQSLSFNSCLI